MLTTTLSCLFHTLALANVPDNFRVALQTEPGHLPLSISGGFLRRDDDGDATPVRIYVIAQGLNRNSNGGQFVILPGADEEISGNATVDIVGMHLEDSEYEPPCLTFSLNYQASFTRHVESIAYTCSPDGNESLIFRPTNMTPVAALGQVSYTNVHDNSFVIAGTRFGNGAVHHNSDLIFSLGFNTVSTLPQDTFDELLASISAVNGVRVERRGAHREVYLANCYQQLAHTLPNLEYVLYDDWENMYSREATTRIVIYPFDYLSPTSDPDRCLLEVNSARFADEPLVIGHQLISRIGGLHFDYANRRIGIFDPL